MDQSEETCDVCFKTFVTQPELKDHLLWAHINCGSESFVCDHCNRIFSDNSAFAEHMGMHHGSSPVAPETATLTFEDVTENFPREDELLLKVENDTECDTLTSDDVRADVSENENVAIIASKASVALSDAAAESKASVLSSDENSNKSGSTLVKIIGSFLTSGVKILASADQSVVATSSKNRKNQRVKSVSNKCAVDVSRPARSGKRAVQDKDSKQLICSKCSKAFRSRKTLKAHLTRLHSDTGTCAFSCSLCSQTFQRSIDLKRHKKEHTTSKDSKLECKVCRTSFTDKAALKQHMFSHRGESEHQCPHCGNLYHTRLGIKQHLSQCTGSGPHSCSYCDKTFAYVHQKRRHELMHTKEKPHSCRLCGLSFARLDALRKHWKKLHNDVEPDDDVKVKRRRVACKFKDLGSDGYACLECDKRKMRREDIMKHCYTHANKHTCDTCGKSFNTPSRLRNHQSFHTGAKPYDCYICGSKSGRAYNLLKHLQTHRSMLSEDSYEVSADVRACDNMCDACSIRYVDKAALKSHVQTEHADKQILQCHVCDMVYTDDKNIKQHQFSHIKRDYGFPCEICGKVLSSRRCLSDHMITHTGDKPFSCKICGKRFTFRIGLRRHMFSHSGQKREKTHVCSTCGKGFPRNAQLQVHLRVHTREKPFVCFTCGKSFSDAANLIHHKRKQKSCSFQQI